MNIYDPGQRMLGVGAALDCDSEGRFALLHDDAQISLMVRHDDGGVLLATLAALTRTPSQPLGTVMTPGWTTRACATRRSTARFLQQLRLLHVVAPRELVRELLKNKTQPRVDGRRQRRPRIWLASVCSLEQPILFFFYFQKLIICSILLDVMPRDCTLLYGKSRRCLRDSYIYYSCYEVR